MGAEVPVFDCVGHPMPRIKNGGEFCRRSCVRVPRVLRPFDVAQGAPSEVEGRGSKLVRPMRTDGKLELKQELVGEIASGVLRPAVLTTNLVELARPVREQQRLAAVAQ